MSEKRESNLGGDYDDFDNAFSDGPMTEEEEAVAENIWEKDMGSKTIFLKVKKDETVRIVTNPIQFWSLFHNKKVVRVDYETCLRVCKDYKKEFDFIPTDSFSMVVIDRADGEVKFLEVKRTIFLEMQKRYKATHVLPHSLTDGGDWALGVEGKGLKTKYSAIYLDKSPLTQAEKEAVKTFLSENAQHMEHFLTKADYDEAVKTLELKA